MSHRRRVVIAPDSFKGTATSAEAAGALAAGWADVRPDDETVLRLARAVADRYAGTLADVLRLAVPARHASVEKEPPPDPAPVPGAPDARAWADYDGGAALVDALAARVDAALEVAAAQSARQRQAHLRARSAHVRQSRGAP